MIAKRVKVLIAKPGLDGHEAGARFVARVLRDAGMEVIYTGMRQTPAMIVETAIQEDVNVIGLSMMSGAHMGLTSRVMQLLRAKVIKGVMVLVGGIIPHDDVPKLKAMGVHEVFGPGTDTSDIIRFIQKNITLLKP